MWIIYSLLAAFFAGLTSIFGKCSVRKLDVILTTSMRTTIILLFYLIIVFFTSSFDELNDININTYFYLILSGISTTILWLSYFKALQLGSISKVTPVDKTSIILTFILSIIFFSEKITAMKIVSMFLILIGTILMVSKDKNDAKDNKWILYAIGTSVFTSIATIVGKIGIKDIESNLGMFLRTLVIFIIIWIIVIIKKRYKDIKKISKKEFLFIILSGVSTGLSWLCYYKGLQLGEVSVVFSIEKLSIVIAVVLSMIFFKEKLNIIGIIGLMIIIIGELFLMI